MHILTILLIIISLCLLVYLGWRYFNSAEWIKFGITVVIFIAYCASLLLFVNLAFRLFFAMLCVITASNHIYREIKLAKIAEDEVKESEAASAAKVAEAANKINNL